MDASNFIIIHQINGVSKCLLTKKFNFLRRLCSLCIGKVPGGRCTHRDPYSGFEGAFRCLLEAGDVAFLKHTTVSEMVASKEFRK